MPLQIHLGAARRRAVVLRGHSARKGKMAGQAATRYTRGMGDTNLPLEDATDFILGAGEAQCAKPAWDILQQRAVSFVWKMTGGDRADK